MCGIHSASEFNFTALRLVKSGSHEKGVSYLHRTATTAYPCFLPDLGGFSRSWSYKTYPVQTYELLCLHTNEFRGC